MTGSIYDAYDDAFWRREAKAEALLGGDKGDRIAQALDHMGWMIVPQPGIDPPGRKWPTMLKAHECPSWAEGYDPPKHPKPRLIKGGKDDDTGSN